MRAARRAHEANEAASLETRKRWVEVMRETARKLIPQLAKYAVDETGYGRVEDKLKKNRCASTRRRARRSCSRSRIRATTG